MRPVCLLDRTKNLHQSDGLHFISTSLAHLFCPLFVGKSSTWPPLCVRFSSSIRRKNLRQSDVLHFISDSFIIRPVPILSIERDCCTRTKNPCTTAIFKKISYYLMLSVSFSPLMFHSLLVPIGASQERLSARVISRMKASFLRAISTRRGLPERSSAM